MWRMGKASAAAAIGAALLGACSAASTDVHPQNFMDLLRAHRFSDAAEQFYYEPSHTPAQLAKDKADIVGFMETLFREIGDIQRDAPLPAGAYTSWTVGISGADHPFSASNVGADEARVVVYEVQLSREGRDWLQWQYVHVAGQWKVLKFEFAIPKSKPGGEQRIVALAVKLFPPEAHLVP
jgi:hypothetical protein